MAGLAIGNADSVPITRGERSDGEGERLLNGRQSRSEDKKRAGPWLALRAAVRARPALFGASWRSPLGEARL